MISIPSCTREVRWELRAEPGVTAECRAVLRVTLAAWDLHDLIDDVLVVVTELLANALVHGGPPVHIAIGTAPDTVTGSVTDRGAGWPRLCPAGNESEHGRGLRIVAALTDAWGVEPVEDGIGKTIWFTRARRPDTGPPGRGPEPPAMAKPARNSGTRPAQSGE
ncbi:ATP-binding protein [Sphaerisporangium dianthi]|uniref:ATP-binding protein n=1 Tax=Sphaerisporangium dianthi TaxID=1436120 RepID=A0ABV9C9L9_9ACTN